MLFNINVSKSYLVNSFLFLQCCCQLLSSLWCWSKSVWLGTWWWCCRCWGWHWSCFDTLWCFPAYPQVALLPLSGLRVSHESSWVSNSDQGSSGVNIAVAASNCLSITLLLSCNVGLGIISCWQGWAKALESHPWPVIGHHIILWMMCIGFRSGGKS